jgi:hypothetical protein
MKTSMNLSFDFRLGEATQKDNVALRKFYQVIFFSPDQGKLDVFTCIACGGKEDLKLNVTTHATIKNESAEKISRADKLKIYRREAGPWRLYWGKSRRMPAQTQNVSIKDIETYISDYREQCNRRECPAHITAETYEEFFRGKNGETLEEESLGYIVLPGDGAHEPDPTRMFSICLPAYVEAEHSSVLEDEDKTYRCKHSYRISRQPDQQHLARLGVDVIDWTHLSIPDVRWANVRGAFPLNVSWEFVNRIDKGSEGGTSYRIDDFKVYFVVRNGYEIDTDDAYVTGSLREGDDTLDPNPFDRMTRQTSAYFKDWINDFDIGSCTVYRLRGRQIDSIGGVPYKKVEVACKIKPRGFTHKQVLAAFALPFIAAIGLDTTRLESAKDALADICANGLSLTGCYFTTFPYLAALPGMPVSFSIFPSIAFMLVTGLVSCLLLIHAFGSAKSSTASQRENRPGGDHHGAVEEEERVPFKITLGSTLAYVFFSLWIICIVVAGDIKDDGLAASSSSFLASILGLTRLYWIIAVVSASATLLWISGNPFRISDRPHLFPMWGLRQTKPWFVRSAYSCVLAVLVLVSAPEARILYTWFSTPSSVSSEGSTDSEIPLGG